MLVITAPRFKYWLIEHLSRDSDLCAIEKNLYLALLFTNIDSASHLARFSGMARGTVREYSTRLVLTGWLKTCTSQGRTSYSLSAPDYVQENMAVRLRDGRASYPYAGQYLMWSWLDFLVCNDLFVDNARPAYLQNPASKQLLEFDRLYPDILGVNFHGTQHYTTTDEFPDQSKLNSLQTRDLIKIGLSNKRGIKYIELNVDDLSYEGMLKKLPESIPLNHFHKVGAYFSMLCKLSDEYVMNFKRGRVRNK